MSRLPRGDRCAANFKRRFGWSGLILYQFHPAPNIIRIADKGDFRTTAKWADYDTSAWRVRLIASGDGFPEPTHAP